MYSILEVWECYDYNRSEWGGSPKGQRHRQKRNEVKFPGHLPCGEAALQRTLRNAAHHMPRALRCAHMPHSPMPREQQRAKLPAHCQPGHLREYPESMCPQVAHQLVLRNAQQQTRCICACSTHRSAACSLCAVGYARLRRYGIEPVSMVSCQLLQPCLGLVDIDAHIGTSVDNDRRAGPPKGTVLDKTFPTKSGAALSVSTRTSITSHEYAHARVYANIPPSTCCRT